MGYDDERFRCDHYTNSILDKVKSSASNFQNKMLLNIKSGDNCIIQEEKELNILMKMNSGYDTNTDYSIIEQLNKSVSANHNILGFLEKLKSPAIIPEGKTKAESIIFDAKINLVRIMCNQEILEPIHIIALYLYSSNYDIFKNVNIAFNNWSTSSIWTNFVNCMYQGVSKLPPYIGEVYRGVECDFNPNVLTIGSVIEWNTFSICSKEWKNASELINKKKGIIFIVKSKYGKDISKYSKYPVDGEVIFKPHSVFKITNHYVASLICLGQENIRESSFKASETDLEKAKNKKCCICVEIEELDNLPMIE